MADRKACDPQAFKLDTKTHNVLQAVENLLLEAGKVDLFVTTEHGSFRWRKTEPRGDERLNVKKWPSGDISSAVRGPV